MLVPGILGFHGLFAVSVLLIFLVIRQKWRNAVARKEEITQLLAVAAEESFMAEIESANEQNYNPVLKSYQCAVCFSPTTTRCSRCKAVRYCSGKCQILHWRQGHKNECCSPTTSMLPKDENDIVRLAASPKQFDIPHNNSEVASDVSSIMDEEVNPKVYVEGKLTGFASGSGPSRGRSELLVNVSAPNEGLGSISVDRLVRPTSDPVTPDVPGKRVRSKKIKQTTAPSLESTIAVIPVEGVSHASKLDKMKLSHNNEEGNCISLQLPKGRTATTDDIQPSKLGGKKSIGGTASPELLVKDASKSRGSSSLSCSRSNHVTKDSEDDSKLYKRKKDRSLSPSMPRLSSATGEHSVGSSKSVLPVYVSSIPSMPQNARHGLKTSMRKVVQQFLVSKPLKSYLLGSENEVTGKYSDKTIFSYDLFLKLYSDDEVELCPFGLTNCGNSCYANAVLQCLAFTRPLTSYLVRGLHSRTCQKKCFICEFECLILKSREGISPLSPISIFSKLQKIGHLGNGREEDAHEFLRCVVDTMQSVCLKEAGAAGLLAEQTTLVGLTFGGYLRSKIKCLKCHGKSERYERMMDLTVEIDGDIRTLEDALAQFTTSETLVGENKYHCSRCKSYEKAKKKLSILEEPNILTIVLKRFQSGNFGKLNKSVRFPEVLNIAPYMSESNEKSPVYSLYAVVVHLDVMNAAFSGHYVCCVKNSHGQWFRIDDSTVMPVELDTVLLEEAYMLLYARHSPRLPALKRNNVVSHGSRSKKKSVETVPSRLSASQLKSNSSIPSAEYKANRKLGPTNNQLYDQEEWRYPSMQRIPRVDSSSESSSIFSSSDASSCSTASTKDSSRSEDLSDFIFGDVGPSWYSSYEFPSNSVASSSYQNYENDSEEEKGGWGRGCREDMGGDGNPTILYNTDSIKHYRNSSHRFVSSSNRDIECEQVAWGNPYDVRLRRTNGHRSAQTFY